MVGIRTVLAAPFIVLWLILYGTSLVFVTIAATIHGDMIELVEKAYGRRNGSTPLPERE